MTEAIPIRQTYEQVRDSFPTGEDSDGSPTVGTLWRDSERWKDQLRDSVNDILSDETLSEEGKNQQVEAAYNRWAPRITGPAQQAKEKAQKLAAEYSQKSVPFPGGASAHTSKVSDATELSAIQQEARDIIEAAKGESLSGKIAQRTGKRVKNVSDAHGQTLEALRTFYGAALESGGIEGKVQAHATLRAAESLGIDPVEVYDPYRTEDHGYYLEQSQRYQTAAQSIRTEPPNLMSRGSVVGNHWRKGGSPRPLLTGGSKGFLPQQRGGRRPSWK